MGFWSAGIFWGCWWLGCTGVGRICLKARFLGVFCAFCPDSGTSAGAAGVSGVHEVLVVIRDVESS
ncbi:hypothetical protein HMPREF0578_0898, partial [Mobiluncus mulieris 28-1]